MSALDDIAPALPAEELPQSTYGAKRTGRLRNTFFTPEEQKGAKKVLSAAALTYVAALAVSLTQFLRLLMIVGRRRRD